MVNRLALTDDEIDELREIFSHYDQDGNGTIDRKEFRALLHALAEDMSEDEIAAGLRAVDEDGSGTIEFDEFMAWWADQ